MLVAGLAACSTAPDWARPSLIYGEDAAAAAAEPSSDKDFPQLVDVPAKPAPLSTADERRQIAEGLAADRQRARYTDEILRGGTEAPAQAPRSAAPAPAPVIASPAIAPAPVASISGAEAGVIPAPARGGSPLPSATAATTTVGMGVDVPQNRAATTQAVEMAPSAPVTAPVAQAAQAPASPAPAATAVEQPVRPQTVRRAAVPALPEGERVSRSGQASGSMIDDRVSAVNAASAAVQDATPSATTSGPSAVQTTSSAVTTGTRPSDRFEASSAPALAQEALDAAGPVVSLRYGTPAGAVTGSADPEDPVKVNLDALRGLSGPGPGASLTPVNGSVVTTTYASQGVHGGPGGQGGPGNIPPYVVNFAHGSVLLSADDRLKVAEAAATALTYGRSVRVVGHASSRTNDVAVGRHVLANFKTSLDRATSVAGELIRNGVDPSLVFVEAKGDAVPVYYESMPAGEAGNRRAEIFIE